MGEYFLKLTSMYVYKLMGWNFINKKEGKDINLKES